LEADTLRPPKDGLMMCQSLHTMHSAIIALTVIQV